MKICENKEKIKELIVYGIFGVLATIVSFGSLYILGKIFVNTDKNILNIISIILAMTFAYFTNRRYVFKSKEKNILQEAIKFAGSRAFSAVFEMLSFYILFSKMQMNEMIAKGIVTFVVIILNYIMSKIFVFKIKKD